MKSPLTTPCLSVMAGLLFCMVGRAVEVDSSFRPNLSGTVHTVSFQQDAIIAGGENFLARLGYDGTIEKDLLAGARIFASVVDSEGRLYTAGSSGVSRFLSDGSPDETFQEIAANGWVLALGVNPDDKIVFGGSFWSQPTVLLGRATESGAVDSTFRPAISAPQTPEGGICAVAIQPDSRLVIAGNFRAAGKSATLVRVNGDGSLDATFENNHGSMLYPRELKVMEDGSILVVGTADSSGRGFVRRLRSDGAVDVAFREPAVDRSVETVAVDSKGRILIGGDFTAINGQTHHHLARLFPDGTLDDAFQLEANNGVRTITIAPNGEILIGGAFSEIGGVQQKGLARLVDAASPRSRALRMTAAGGELHLSLKGEAGHTYMIERSTDLRSWTVLATNVASSDGLSIDGNLTASPKQFFRARAVE